VNPYPRTWIDIDLSLLAGNLAHVRQAVGPKPLIALVAKADAYGHGLIPIVRQAIRSGADWICVATVQEGIALRDAGISAPILVISPILPVEAEQAVFYELRITIERFETAKALNDAGIRQDKKALVHLEVDTGLSRFGCAADKAAELLLRLKELDQIEVEGLSHHFVDSGANQDRTKAQIKIFDDLISELSKHNICPKMLHGSNSAGAISYPEHSKDMVRVGILAYGIDPYGIKGEGTKPLLSWYTRVTALREIEPLSTVGYCEGYRTFRNSKIATLGAGYGDGYPRSLSNLGRVVIKGKIARVIGLVCMDQMMVEASDIEDLEVGEIATLIGPEQPVELLAKYGKTNCHEIPTRIMSRVPRRYLSK
jgi:alanine racemase